MAAGFAGHGMPRILLSAAHIVHKVLESLKWEHKAPALVANYPALPGPFHATAERVERLQQTADLDARLQAYRESCQESAAKAFCNDERSRPKI